LARAPARLRGSDDPFRPARRWRQIGCWAEIEALIHEIAGIGDSIAHDLPHARSTRVRVRLEAAGRKHASTLEQSRAVRRSGDRRVSTNRLAIITGPCCASPRSSHSRRLDSFSVGPARPRLLREGGRSPMSRSPEDKACRPFGSEAADMKRRCTATPRSSLFEAVVNLVDNRREIHTPKGGRVDLALLRRDGERPFIRVSDHPVPGIPETERESGDQAASIARTRAGAPWGSAWA